MAAKGEIVSKRLQISKTNLFIVIVVSIASFVTIISLTTALKLFSQQQYQSKVISQKETAKQTLEANLEARDQLVKQYKSFAASGVNIIGGSSTGTNDRDGDNARIILDALPSKYDYPALATSLEKLLVNNGMSIETITGTDDELNQAAGGAATPTVVEMPFSLGYSGNKQATAEMLNVLNRSIRPMHIQQLTLTGNEENLTTVITAKTYYQPEKTFQVTKEVVQ